MMDMTMPVANPAEKWIFVSHASCDIQNVRKVRNYLERRRASPLLFHLLSMSNPDQFWPVIKSEIAARNFFLYCESERAKEREWVQRERAEVERVQEKRPIRIGKVRVDCPRLDRQSLDDFLSDVRVYPSYSRLDLHRVEPFLIALTEAGFSVSRTRGLVYGTEWKQHVDQVIRECSKNGWVLEFVTRHLEGSSWAAVEMRQAREHRAKIVPILLEGTEIPYQYSSFQVFDATNNLQAAPQNLVLELLRRPT